MTSSSNNRSKMVVGEKTFFNEFLEGNFEKAFGVKSFLFQEMLDIASFNNSNDFFSKSHTADETMSSLAPKLITTSLKMHSELTTIEYHSQYEAQQPRIIEDQIDGLLTHSFSSSLPQLDSGPSFGETKKNISKRKVIFFQHFDYFLH